MTAADIVATLRSRGARLRLVEGNAIAVSPTAVLDDTLRAAIRREKPALVALLRQGDSPAPGYAAIYASIAADTGNAEDVVAIDWYATLNGDGILDEFATLERRCEQFARVGADETTYRAAVTILVARMSQIRAWYSAAQGDGTTSDVPRYPWRLTLDANHPVAGPARLDDGTEIIDVPKFVAQTFTAIEYVLRRPPRSYPDGAVLIRLYVKQLEQIGVVARVEPVS